MGSEFHCKTTLEEKTNLTVLVFDSGMISLSGWPRVLNLIEKNLKKSWKFSATRLDMYGVKS